MNVNFAICSFKITNNYWKFSIHTKIKLSYYLIWFIINISLNLCQVLLWIIEISEALEGTRQRAVILQNKTLKFSFKNKIFKDFYIIKRLEFFENQPNLYIENYIKFLFVK